MRTNLIALSAISVRNSAPDFATAVIQATTLLVENNYVLEGYVGEVSENLSRLGPYFAVAPDIAIAHARPGKEVLAPGLALLKLNQPVSSGHQLHNQVRLIFALATPDSEAHLDLMGNLAGRLTDTDLVNSVLNASAESVIWELLNS